jgi:hypothetical protein
MQIGTAIVPPKPEEQVMKEQTMKRQYITFPFVLAHAWVLMIFFGALVFDTLIVYPNTFHDVPRSLERAMAFATVRGPGDFFPPLGFASWITGIGSLILSWRIKPARYWVLASLVVIACEGLFSMAFFWPRNTIMFTEGTAIHSVAFLKQTAREFEVGHWIRFALGAAAAATSFTGFLKFYRYRILSRHPYQEAQVAVGGRSSASADASPRKGGTSYQNEPGGMDPAVS